jgi:hypothetical protein
MLINRANSLLSLETFTRNCVYSLILYRRRAVEPECYMVANGTDLVRLMTSQPRGLGPQIDTEGVPMSHYSR